MAKTTFQKWLIRFAEEKEIDMSEPVVGKGGCRLQVGDVLSAAMSAPASEQRKLKDAFVKIDFMNGDVMRFIRHIAQALDSSHKIGIGNNPPAMSKTAFRKATGRAAELDDLERANCSKAGKPGHRACGICKHGKPVFECQPCFKSKFRNNPIAKQKCECENIGHFDRKPTIHGHFGRKPTHAYGAEMAGVTRKRTEFGTFGLCKDCADICQKDYIK